MVSVLEDFARGFGFGSVAGPELRFATDDGAAHLSVESKSKKRRTCFYIGGSKTKYKILRNILIFETEETERY